MKNVISDKVLGLQPSGIRKFFDIVSEMDDVISLGVGEPDFDTPWHIRDEGIFSLEKGRTFYTSNAGLKELREEICRYLSRRCKVDYTIDETLITVGGSEAIDLAMRVLLNPGDEVIVFAPYFGEYNNYVANYGGKVVVISPDTATFMPKLDELEKKITAKTKAVIINTPNNPTGVVYSEKVLQDLAKVLEDKQTEFGTDIYLISDEPYRELVYGSVEVPYVTKYYANTIVGYSYSKSLSLPGERIGYLVLPDEMADAEDVIGAANVATRILGFVNAPSLQQLTIARCLDAKVDVEIYDKNRRLLVDSLRKFGFECASPDGAFYLFVKTLEDDDKAFVARAKEEHLLLVPGSSFACPGYVRIAYCVDYDMIERSLPAFERLAESYK